MPEPGTLVRSLLNWFTRNARDLPWRKTTDPYAIWVSEIMLQQTQVKTVVPYWERWMRRFPSVQTLSKARLDEVLKSWEGLGYYSRARNLRESARRIVSQHRGVFPQKVNDWLALPGIGRYTAGAICSIAFNQPTPILDGNIIRVLSRLFAIKEDPRRKETNTRLWNIAEQLVALAATLRNHDARNCSALNQALMELGATVCTPRQPKCASCPVQKHCAASRKGQAESFPKRNLPRKTKNQRMSAFVIMKRGRILVRQRPANGINAHLWEFPNVAATHRSTKHLAKTALGFSIHSVQSLGILRHTITHHRIVVEVYHGELEPPVQSHRNRHSVPLSGREMKTRDPSKLAKETLRTRWCTLSALDKLAFTGAHRKIVQILKSLSENSKGSCFRGKGVLARRDERLEMGK